MSRHVLTPVAVAVFSLSVLGPPVQAQDNPSAQELADLRARAEQGHAIAQYKLGLMYIRSERVRLVLGPHSLQAALVILSYLCHSARLGKLD